MSSLQGKHILVGITGSIAAYKACTLIRLLVKEGCEVQAVITPAGKEFITPLTLSTLTGRAVVSEFFDRRDGSWHSHVKLGLWADAFVIAPASADTLAKMAHGVADNMLLTTYLSMRAPTFVAPAMDLDMYAHTATRRNLETLRQDGVNIIEPEEGELASHLVGKGRMEEPEEIVDQLEAYFAGGELQRRAQLPLGGKRILITAGPTHERIDAVRYIGNYSTGKMGFALAEACVEMGAIVDLVTGPVALPTPSEDYVSRTDVVSAREMLEAAERVFPVCDAAILCAAVADFTLPQQLQGKLKREGSDGLTLHLTPTADIAASLGAKKRPDQRLVGFALETDHEHDHAVDKLRRKHLDFIVLNSLRDPGAGFAHDTNKVTILNADGTEQAYPLKDKHAVARDIVAHLAEVMHQP